MFSDKKVAFQYGKGMISFCRLLQTKQVGPGEPDFSSFTELKKMFHELKKGLKCNNSCI